MNEEKVEGYYQARAKETVDMLYDKGFLDQSVSRESMQHLEDYLAWWVQNSCHSAVRVHDLSKRARKRNSE